MRAAWIRKLALCLLMLGPGALTWCQIECGLHAVATAATALHSCHDTQTTGTRVSSPGHACGHVADLGDESLGVATVGASFPLDIVTPLVAARDLANGRAGRSDRASPVPVFPDTGAPLRI